MELFLETGMGDVEHKWGLAIFEEDLGFFWVGRMRQDGTNVVVEDPAAFIQARGMRGKGVDFFRWVDGDWHFMLGTGLMDHSESPTIIGGSAIKTGCFDHVERSLFDVKNLVGFVDDGVVVKVFGWDDCHRLFVNVVRFVNGFNCHRKVASL